jgi:2-keto-3-deoxy-L-rhamnonate aldolase RhmA/pimeloyl-ACP methyl ester carboxylesterase
VLRRAPGSGLMVKMPACRQIEMAATAGFDYVIVDCEHGPWDGIELEHHLRAAELAGLPVLVRVPAAEGPYILWALDAGAAGIVVPHVRDPETAVTVVAAARYPPRGSRGAAGSTRAGAYGAKPVGELLSPDLDVVVQIEDEQALELVSEIAAVPGVTALFAGTFDLGVATGWGRERIAAAVSAVAAAAERNDLAAIAPAADAAQGENWRERGVTSIALVDTTLTLGAYRRALSSHERVSADAVLLLPGMLCDATLWNDVTAALSTGDRTIPARIDLDDSVAEMAASVLAVAPPRFALAGHSLGAIVALEITRRAPERVAGLALVNASARGPSPEQLRAWDEMEATVHEGRFDDLVEDYPSTVLPPAAGEVQPSVRRMARSIGPGGLIRQLTAQRAREDLRATLSAVRCPTVVVSGADDRVAPPELQDELAAGIPGASLARIEGCGHVAPLEHPKVVASVLDEWAEAC